MPSTRPSGVRAARRRGEALDAAVAGRAPGVLSELAWPRGARLRRDLDAALAERRRLSDERGGGGAPARRPAMLRSVKHNNVGRGLAASTDLTQRAACRREGGRRRGRATPRCSPKLEKGWFQKKPGVNEMGRRATTVWSWSAAARPAGSGVDLPAEAVERGPGA